jgi:biofilm PGA synthesis N-glycosyltransferase PgaC
VITCISFKCSKAEELTVNPTRYVIITPARNEERAIEHTIRSVISQTIKPEKWVIVSDASTDRTDGIVQDYCKDYPFIRFIRSFNNQRRNFGSKVAAFNAGYVTLTDQQYEFIGNLDADVSFAPDYFANLIDRFARIPKLGVGGGLIQELVGSKFVAQDISRNSVAGAVQFFRRRCFEDIGGYQALPGGGIDAVAEIMARQRGWLVETFLDLYVHHHRRVTSGAGSVLATEFRHGQTAYRLGYQPLFALATSMSRLPRRPYVIGAIAHSIGYSLGYLRRERVHLPRDTVKFLRAEQLQRLKHVVSKLRFTK